MLRGHGPLLRGERAKQKNGRKDAAAGGDRMGLDQLNLLVRYDQLPQFGHGV